MRKTIVPLLSVLALTACVSSAPETSARLGAKPLLAGGTYTVGGGITIAAEMRDRGGKTEVCGVWAESHLRPATLRGKALGIVSAAAVFVGNERVTHDLSFMRQVEPQRSYGGLPANCRLTARPWTPGDARRMEIRIPQMQVGHPRSGVGLGQKIMFKQTGPGAGSPDDKRAEPKEEFVDAPQYRGLQRVPMVQNPDLMKVTYQPYGEILMAAMITQIGGRVAVCGIWTKSKREQSYVKAANLLTKTRASSKITLRGKTIVNNLLFFNRVEVDDFASGTPANCQVTSVPWQAGYSTSDIEIRTPSSTTIG